MIRVSNVGFSYKKTSLFDGLDLELAAGGIYGLLGRNGAGKTSLLKLLSGQLFPAAGDCSVLDFNPSRRSPELLREIYFLPEEFHTPSITGEAYLGAYAPFYPRFDRVRFSELAGEFEISIQNRLASMSYGQKKKFLLAFAFSTGSKILLLDEPTNGLDIPSKRQFRRAVASSIESDQVILISTHQVRDMEHLIDPIIILEAGKIVLNYGIGDIADRLSVTMETQEPVGEDVLYSEMVVGGYTVLRARHAETDGRAVDLELLFNAIVSPDSRLGEFLDKEVVR